MQLPIQTTSSMQGRQRGVTLIEVLVTLLVLAVGLLGLAALQGISLQSGQGSLLRTQATNFAYEITDHARANRSTVEANSAIPNQDFWEQRVTQLLPEGAVAIDVDGQIVTVTVTWLDDRGANVSDPQDGPTTSFEMTTRI